MRRSPDMAALWFSSILLLLVQKVTSEFDSSVCQQIKISNGLVPPPLPTNFELKGETVDHLRNSTVYEELYFDYAGNHVKYMILNRSVEHHYLFDYATSQVVEWDVLHPGVDIKRDPLSQECSATEMEESPYAGIFGFEAFPRFKMASANQALRYGGQYAFAANGTRRLDDRGLLVNEFMGCLYDGSLDASIKSSISFTNDKVEPAGATITSLVTGFDDGYLSVPARIKMQGNMADGQGGTKWFNLSLSISWFKAEPEFALGTFQIPPWVYCKGYRGRKDLPKFPTAFMTRLTLTQFQLDAMGEMGPASVGTDELQNYETIFYYGDKNLARRDFVPTPFRDKETFDRFQSMSPVQSIYDFNQGVRFTVDKPTGRCYIKYLTKDDYFVDTKFKLGLKLAAPEEIFMMKTDTMEYKGKRFTRDIECDVWAGQLYVEEDNITYVKETYFSTNGWHEEADEMVEYGVPVKHLVIEKTLTDELTEGVAVYNFLKFKSQAPPPLQAFSLENCVEFVRHLRYALILDVTDEVKATLYKYRSRFLENAQYYIADMAETLSPLRVQRLQLLEKTPPGESAPITFLLFTMLDKPEFRTPELVEIAGPSLDDAIINLLRVVYKEAFRISFLPPDAQEATTVYVKPGDLYLVTPGGDLHRQPLDEKTDDSIPSHKIVFDPFSTGPIQQADDDEAGDKQEYKGMSSGNLTLLAFAMLFIGVGIGIALMYLYVRFYDERSADDRIKMTESGKGATEINLEEASTSAQ